MIYQTQQRICTATEYAATKEHGILLPDYIYFDIASPRLLFSWELLGTKLFTENKSEEITLTFPYAHFDWKYTFENDGVNEASYYLTITSVNTVHKFKIVHEESIGNGRALDNDFLNLIAINFFTIIKINAFTPQRRDRMPPRPLEAYDLSALKRFWDYAQGLTVGMDLFPFLSVTELS